MSRPNGVNSVIERSRPSRIRRCYDDIEAADASSVGLQHGGDAPDPVDPGGRSPPQRAACAGRGALDLRTPSFDLAESAWCSIRRPTSTSSTRLPTTSSGPSGQQDFVAALPCSSEARPTSVTAFVRAPPAKEGHRRRQANDATDMSFDEYARFVSRLHARTGSRDVRRAAQPHRGARRNLCDRRSR